MNNDLDKDSLEYRCNLFKEHPFYRWPPIEDEKNKSKRGRKPAPSKRVLTQNQEHYKWWRK